MAREGNSERKILCSLYPMPSMDGSLTQVLPMLTVILNVYLCNGLQTCFSYLEQLFPNWTSAKSRYLSLTQCAVFDSKRSQPIIQKLLLLDRCEQERFPIVMLDLFLTILKGMTSASCVEKKQELSTAERRLKQIEIYTSCNYARHISLADVAQYVGMNRSAFCTFFSRETGESYMTYLNRHRLKVARQMIEKDESSISSICWQCGFNDLSYFDRLFRREFGISPTESKMHKLFH